MSKKDIRSAISQAKFNDEAASFLGFEILFMSIAIGLATQSWWVFGGVLFGTWIALAVSKIFACVLCIALSLCWASIGYYGIGGFFSSPSARPVLGIIAFVITLGLHLSAMEWNQDMSS